MTHSAVRDEIAGVLLAGGQARRMGGGDKCLRMLGGQTLLARIVDRVRPQVGTLMLNANGDPTRFAAYGLPVERDRFGDAAGPLAGVLTGMAWAVAAAPGCRWIATFPTDAPFLPVDLVARLHEAAVGCGLKLACGSSGGRQHPVVGLWHLSLLGSLRRAFVDEGVRKVDAWTAQHGIVNADYPTEPVDPFLNMNRPEDLERAGKLLGDRAFEESAPG